jgi:outer membrane protein
MKLNIRLLARWSATAAAAAAVLASGSVLAQNHTFKAGIVRYDAHSRTNGVTGIGIPPGADAKVGDATTLLLTYEYEIKPNVGIELAVGIPPKIKATATGSVAFLGEVLSARNVAPTLLVNYHFGQKGDTWRPYFGAGVNYTKFMDVTTPYGWDVKLRDSVGMALHGGINLAMARDWGFFASVARVDVKSKLVATGAVVLESKIDFRPWTYEAGLFYRF